MPELHRDRLTPQMSEYMQFNEMTEARYPAYLMYHHRTSYRSDVINTDRSGFRFSVGPGGRRAAVSEECPTEPVSILSGSSTALGLGATSDEHTLASLLWSTHAPSTPWLNMGGRCHNPTQEALQFMLYRHLLPEVKEIVVLSGLNAVTLARLPEWQQGDNGAFWFCGEYFHKMEELRQEKKNVPGWKKLLSSSGGTPSQISTYEDLREDMDVVVAEGAELTLRNLETWQLLAPRARVTFVLQPFSLWMRDERAHEEQLLFDEIDRISVLGTWEELYGNISRPAVKDALAQRVEEGCRERGIGFVDLNPVVRDQTSDQDWLFVDRAHYTDHGHDVVAGLLAKTVGLE